MDELSSIKIPIPTLERQHQIVDDCMVIEENKIQAEKMIVRLEGMAQSYHTNHIHRMLYDGSAEVKTLGEVCTFKHGSTNSRDGKNMNTGMVPFYAATVTNPSGFVDIADFDDDEYLLYLKSGGNSKNPIGKQLGICKVYYVNGKSSANIAVFKLDKIVNINMRYLYYFIDSKQLSMQKKYVNYCTGNGNTDMEKLKNEFKIPIPTLERQLQIVADMDDLYSQIESAKNIVASYDKWIKLAIAL
jgi:restriction endonuclease S subunit